MKKEDIKEIKKAIGEVVGPYFAAIQGEFSRIDGWFNKMEERLQNIEARLVRLEEGYENLRVEVREIRYLLQQKASVEELNELDSRVTRIEVKLRKAGVL